MVKGKLFGVGIGPGDKELITLKAVNTIKNADIIALPDSFSGKNRTYEIIKEWKEKKHKMKTHSESGIDSLSYSKQTTLE